MAVKILRNEKYIGDALLQKTYRYAYIVYHISIRKARKTLQNKKNLLKETY